MQKQHELHRGKSKTVYATDQAGYVIMEFRNDATAFNGQKHAILERKGEVNNKINAFIMQKLAEAGIKSHFVERISETESLVKSLEMLPIECIVRNVAAGSFSKRLGVEEGRPLKRPIFEFCYKSDPLGDPLVNDDHIVALEWATEDDVKALRELTFKVNEVLRPLFAKGNLTLVDYKLEFGRSQGELLLGDEFSPDGCRLWDSTTGEKMDKDRFRRDQGSVIEHYIEVGKRIGVAF